jgi:hypothetical protein
VDEQERRDAVAKLMDWQRQDDTVRDMIKVVCRERRQPGIGHLARFCPEEFDVLYEESEAMVTNEMNPSGFD